MKYRKVQYYKFIFGSIWRAGPINALFTVAQYLLSGISATLILLYTGKLINLFSAQGGNNDNVKSEIIFCVVIIAMAEFVQIISEEFSQFIREKQIYKIQKYIDRLICDRLLNTSNDRLDTKEFRDQIHSITQTNTPIYLFTTYAAQLVSQTVQLIAPLTLIIKLSPYVFILFLVFSAVCIKVVSKTQFAYWSSYISETSLRRKMQYFLSVFHDREQMATLRAFRAEEFFLKKTSDTLYESMERARRRVFKQNKNYAILQLMILSFPVLVTVLAVRRFVAGAILAGDVVMLLGVGKNVHSAIISMGTTIRNVRDENVKMERLYHFLSEGEDAEAADGEIELDGDIEEIRVENLSFAYPGREEHVLHHLSFTILKGQRLAIVGENGSGKTTFVKILMGLYRNYEGNIFVNHIELRSYTRQSRVRMFAPCFQDYLKPHFLLKEAVGFSDYKRIEDEKRIKRSIAEMDVDGELQKIPLSVQLGKEFSEGIELSLGQWQKVAVARTAYAGAGVNLWDEPLASIDLQGEMNFYKGVASLKSRRDICVMISHRMSGIASCDRIIVLQNGRLIEQGDHQSLMNLGGKYCELFIANTQNM